MTYNILADLAVFGLFLMGLGVTIVILERKARRYAVPEPDREKIRMHQHIRRYTVSGNGVAHRKASNYMADPKVIDQLRRIER